MARDATARLYDVDEDSVVFKKLDKKRKYDQGTISFRARKGKVIDLDKLHESIWATRLSGGTRSGLVTLEVTAIGQVQETAKGLVLKVANSRKEFVLAKHPDERHVASFDALKAANRDGVVRVTGRIDDYRGRWPGLLKQPPPGTRRLLVTSFTMVKES